MSQRTIIKLSELKLEDMIFHFEFGTISFQPKQEEIKPPLPVLFLFYLQYKNLFPKELWRIIGKFHRKSQFDDIIYRLRRHHRNKFSLSMSGPTLVLRTTKKSIKNTTDKIFGDVINTSIKKSTGPWLCKHKHKLVGANEELSYNQDPDNSEWDFSPGEGERWNYKGKCFCINQDYNDWNSCPSTCGPIKIINYEIIFPDLLQFVG